MFEVVIFDLKFDLRVERRVDVWYFEFVFVNRDVIRDFEINFMDGLCGFVI